MPPVGGERRLFGWPPAREMPRGPSEVDGSRSFSRSTGAARARSFRTGCFVLVLRRLFRPGTGRGLGYARRFIADCRWGFGSSPGSGEGSCPRWSSCSNSAALNDRDAGVAPFLDGLETVRPLCCRAANLTWVRGDTAAAIFFERVPNDVTTGCHLRALYCLRLLRRL